MLRIIFSKGRSGGLTTTTAVKKLVKQFDLPYRVEFEYRHNELYDKISLARSDVELQDIALDLYDDLTKNNILNIGAGYAFHLRFWSVDKLKKIKGLSLLRDFNDWLPGLIKNTHLWDHNSINYIVPQSQIARSAPGSSIQEFHFRPAAYHYGQMTEKEWMNLSLRDKLYWYYTEQGNQLDRHVNQFLSFDEVKTESLSSEAAFSKLLAFLDIVPDEKLNWQMYLSRLNSSSTFQFKDLRVNRFFKELDPQRSMEDPVTMLEFAFNKVFLGYQNRLEYQHSTVSEENLERAINIASDFVVRAKRLLSLDDGFI